MPNVLILDDEYSIQFTLREVLEEENHTVFTAGSYNEAVPIIQRQKIQIVVADIILPGKSGLEFLDFVKSHYNNIQVLILTGEPTLETAIRAIRAGAADYLAKPVNLKEFLDSISRIYKTYLLLELKDKLDYENKQIRKKLEQLLKEKTSTLDLAEERFKSVAMTAADAFIIMDEDLSIIEINKSAEDIFGYSNSEMTILQIDTLIPNLTKENIHIFFNDENSQHSIHTYTGIKKNEEKFPVEISIGKWSSKNKTFFSAIIHDISARRQIELKQRKLSQAIEQSPTGIVITDINGTIEYVNPKFETLTGYSSEEIVGRNQRILKSEKTDLTFYKKMWSAISSGKIWQGDILNKNKKGDFFWEAVYISPVKDELGKVTNYIAIKEDITEKKENERVQELLLKISNVLQEESNYKLIMQKMQSLLSELLNTKNFFIALYDKEQKSLYFPYYEDENDEYEYLPAKGTLSNHIIQSRVAQLISKDQYKKLLEEKTVEPIGTPAAIWAGVPILINNEPIGIVVAQDYEDETKLGEKELQLLQFVTNQIGYVIERNNNKEALAYEKEELSVTIGSLAEAIITTDLNGKIKLVNNAVENIFNVRESMMIGEQIFKFFWNSTDNGLERLKTFYQRLKLGGIHYKDEQFTISFSQKKRKIIKVSTSSLQLQNRKIKGVVFVIRDITQQLEIENQLALSQKMESIGQLAAGIAHEINTPMQYIGDNTTFLNDSFTELLEFMEAIVKAKTDSLSSDEFKSKISDLIEGLDLEFLKEEIPESINQSQLGIERVRTLVLAMKDFAHPGQKQKTLSDINKGIEVTSTISKNEWKYIASLELELKSDLPLVPVVLDEINQVILNIIVNGSHAIEERKINEPDLDGTIKISTRPLNKYVEIIIKDNGTGIPQEKVERIFDPFYTTKEVGKGTGQGLAIAHNIIVNKHNGKITVNSVEGKGTTFIIQLPLEEKK